MKRTVFLVLSFFLATVAMQAEDKVISKNELPDEAKMFIKSYFPSNGIVTAKMDKSTFGTDYEVVLSDQTEIDFDQDGIWFEVDCKENAVPSGIVPTQITNQVTEMYPDLFIVRIDKERKGFEVKLSDEKELKFDKNLKLIKMEQD